MKLFFILGNQLFPPKYLDRFKNDHLFFMSEDHELCTYEKHHKLKILLFLSAMRSHLDHLKKNRFKVEYSKIDTNDFKMYLPLTWRIELFLIFPYSKIFPSHEDTTDFLSSSIL